MKQIITVLTLFYSLINFSQFDRKIIEPLVENPSFVGSTNENRLATTYSIRKLKNRQTISYDFFSNKLGGGWGVAVSNDKLFDSREATIRVAYSPKITPRFKKVTWAPGIGLLYNRVYAQAPYIGSNAFDSAPVILEYSTIRNSIQGTISIARNSKKTLTTALLSYDPALNIFENKAFYFIKLNENNTNDFSSTLGGGYVFLLKNNLGLSEGFIGDNMFSTRFEIPEKQFRLNLAYYVRWKGLRLGLEHDDVIWVKNTEGSKEERQYREISYFSTAGKSSVSIAYTHRFLTFSVIYTKGRLSRWR